MSDQVLPLKYSNKNICLCIVVSSGKWFLTYCIAHTCLVQSSQGCPGLGFAYVVAQQEI